MDPRGGTSRRLERLARESAAKRAPFTRTFHACSPHSRNFFRQRQRGRSPGTVHGFWRREWKRRRRLGRRASARSAGQQRAEEGSGSCTAVADWRPWPDTAVPTQRTRRREWASYRPSLQRWLRRRLHRLHGDVGCGRNGHVQGGLDPHLRSNARSTAAWEQALRSETGGPAGNRRSAFVRGASQEAEGRRADMPIPGIVIGIHTDELLR